MFSRKVDGTRRAERNSICLTWNGMSGLSALNVDALNEYMNDLVLTIGQPASNSLLVASYHPVVRAIINRYENIINNYEP